MRVWRRVLTAVALAALAMPQGAAAWGLGAHRWVAIRAAELVRESCPALGAAPRSVLGDAAVEPDTVLKRRDGRREGVRHYFNLDYYGPPPFRALPRDRRAAEARFGQSGAEAPIAVVALDSGGTFRTGPIAPGHYTLELLVGDVLYLLEDIEV